MTNSRRKMREASRSLAMAFNIGRIQEALYRVDAGETLDDAESAILAQLGRLFADASRGLDWTEATVAGGAADEFSDTQALRSLSMVLPVIRSYPEPAREILKLLTEVATKLGTGIALERNERMKFDAVLSDLASHAGRRLDDALSDRDATVSLRALPE